MPQHPGHIAEMFKIGDPPGPDVRGIARDATRTRAPTGRRDLLPRGRSIGPGPRVRRRQTGPTLADVFSAAFQGLIDFNDPLGAIGPPGGAAALGFLTRRPTGKGASSLLDALRSLKQEVRSVLSQGTPAAGVERLTRQELVEAGAESFRRITRERARARQAPALEETQSAVLDAFAPRPRVGR